MSVWDNYLCDGQTHLFDFLADAPQYYKTDKKIRLIELFAGIGAQAKALERLGVDFEHYKVVEFDKYAVASYNAIHGTDFEPMDIRQVKGADLDITDKEHFTYLLTYSFPCQDLSVAGKGRGMKKGSGTRSGLLWEVERLLNETNELPDILLMENVPMVHSLQNEQDFKSWCESLERMGYSNFWKDMNAKDYGVAQSRDRTFMVSILQKKVRFDFPKPTRLTKVISDYLVDNVDTKYYIDNEKTFSLLKKLIEKDSKYEPFDGAIGSAINSREFEGVGFSKLSPTLCARDYKDPKVTVEKVKIKQATKSGFTECEVGGVADLSFPNSETRRGRVIDNGNTCPTLQTEGEICRIEKEQEEYRIRKITPRETFRLMNFDDVDFEKASSVNSNTQLYKQSGNSIVVACLCAIFSQLNIQNVKAWNQMTFKEKERLTKIY